MRLDQGGELAPTNDARALHDLLEAVGEGSRAPTTAWEAALGAEWGSVEFARRHAETLNLYVGTLNQVASLPDRSRERFERYAWLWWTSVVAPQHAWSANVTMTSAVDPGALDQLGSLADVVEVRMQGSLAVSTAIDLRPLREVCQEWVDMVMAESALTESLRLNLLQDLHHIVWLIDNVNLFGATRVAAAGEKIIGNVAVCGDTLPIERRHDWREKGKRLVAAVVLLGSIHAGVDAGIAIAQGAGSFITELTSSAPNLPSAPGPETDPSIGPDAST